MHLKTNTKTSRHGLISFWLFLFVIQVQVSICHAADQRIAVIYPLVQKPYSTVFELIIDGISAESDLDIVKYGLEKIDEEQNTSLQEWLLRQQPDVVIALGRRGIEGTHNLDLVVPIVFGGVLYASETTMDNSPGISLTPDPGLLFNQLKHLSPNTKRIFVVYNPERYQWLIDLAETAASSLGLSLVAKTARGLRDSARIHREILRRAENKTDSVWLLQDSSIMGTNTILPMILKESWNKKLLVFSSNPGDVPRGTLFSYYADNKALGRNLARLAVNSLDPDNEVSNSIVALSSALSAVNIRTASHIGLHIPYEEQRKFGLVFPRK